MTLNRFNALAAAGLLAPLSLIAADASAGGLVFDTNLGEIVVDLFDDVAPLTAAQFIGIAERGDFDGTLIHRSADTPFGEDFVIQGGGFTLEGDPFVEGAAAFGLAPVVDPVLNEPGVSNTRGTIALARSEDVNSGTNQFFFNLTDNSFLDTVNEGFTVFGEITEGLDVADAIAALDIEIFTAGPPFNEVPVTDAGDFVVLNSVTVVEDTVVPAPPVIPDTPVIPDAEPDAPAAPDAPAVPGTPAAVPSPSALVGGLLGLGALAARRRRGR